MPPRTPRGRRTGETFHRAASARRGPWARRVRRESRRGWSHPLESRARQPRAPGQRRLAPRRSEGQPRSPIAAPPPPVECRPCRAHARGWRAHFARRAAAAREGPSARGERVRAGVGRATGLAASTRPSPLPQLWRTPAADDLYDPRGIASAASRRAMGGLSRRPGSASPLGRSRAPRGTRMFRPPQCACWLTMACLRCAAIGQWWVHATNWASRLAGFREAPRRSRPSMQDSAVARHRHASSAAMSRRLNSMACRRRHSWHRSGRRLQRQRAYGGCASVG
eukprot:7004111-Prymnesium_polylepis.1